MGYCISHEEGSIKIKKENMNRAINILREYIKSGNKLRWVNGDWFDEDTDTLEYIWEDLRYELEDDDEYYKIVEFTGEKLGDDDKIFELIAPYCEDGYLQFTGEDGEHFRFVIKDGKFAERWAKISWD
jgi:hypothetical protein